MGLPPLDIVSGILAHMTDLFAVLIQDERYRYKAHCNTTEK